MNPIASSANSAFDTAPGNSSVWKISVPACITSQLTAR